MSKVIKLEERAISLPKQNVNSSEFRSPNITIFSFN